MSDENAPNRLADNDEAEARPALKQQVLHPKNPERICWGCDRYCPANDLVCGNGTIRTPHPAELLGDDWLD